MTAADLRPARSYWSSPSSTQMVVWNEERRLLGASQFQPAWPKNSSWPLPCPKTHCFAHVDDKSGPGGLLSEEIPGILNICADCEPMVSCPVDFYAASLS